MGMRKDGSKEGFLVDGKMMMVRIEKQIAIVMSMSIILPRDCLKLPSTSCTCQMPLHHSDGVNNALDSFEHQIQLPCLVPHGSHLLLVLGRHPTTSPKHCHHIAHRKHSSTQIMADVEMMDAPVKSGKAGADTAVDGKKRFEVKKVRRS